MSMERIRKFYGIPAKRGMRVLFQGVPHVITGTTRGPMYIRIRPVEGGKPFAIHPTWEVVYPGMEPEQESCDRGPCCLSGGHEGGCAQ